ncbi:MAG: methyltransferase domain-containing protein [Oscillospiraceae bacterium]|nr:methyltransferase domain-containing protein [Oscillospiraceae bacterium]
MMTLICPVCGSPLTPEPARYLCTKNHSFDRAKSGYVNLLMRQKHRQRGDDTAMLAARRDFLDQGFYLPLLDAVAEAIPQNTETLADIGCGEGWYSCGLLKRFSAASLAGFDISPDAVRYAAQRAKAENTAARSCWAVASVNHIPLADESCRCILNLFAPCEPAEFARILAKDGLLIRAVPLERHLWELKCAVYDEPYENRPVLAAPEGFTLISQKALRYPINVSGDALHTLFAMTPYAHKTARSDAAKLDALTSLTVTVEFGVLICKKQ